MSTPEEKAEEYLQGLGDDEMLFCSIDIRRAYLAGYSAGFNAGLDTDKNAAYAEGWNEGVEEAIDKAAGPQWISVKERLPEVKEPVLGWAKYPGQPIICYRDTELDDYGDPSWQIFTFATGHSYGKWEFLEYNEEYPTHWMPLPEPPMVTP
jgi:hypothetical protein